MSAGRQGVPPDHAPSRHPRSLERFIGALIEHFAGRCRYGCAYAGHHHSVSERGINYARQIEKVLLEQGIRVAFDARNERYRRRYATRKSTRYHT